MEYNLLLIGVALILAEIIIPGIGVFGILGVILLIASCFSIMGGSIQAITALGASYILIALVILILCIYFPKKNKWNPFVLWEKQKNVDGYIGSDEYSEYLNKKAVTITPLRPSGIVELDGIRIDASSLGDYIEKNENVKVVKVEGNKLFVKKI